MRPPKPPPIERQSEDLDRMWPLDLSIAALAGLVLYVTVTQFRFDDPRWLFNAWTYCIAVPLVALFLAIFSHGIVSRYVQKSIQLGFLFSVFVHLLLLMLAINVIIFSRYFPEAFSGVKQERSPVRRTVPEYIFQTPVETATKPDWSKPVEAETTSKVVPQEQRQLPPVENTEPRLELPKPKELQQPQIKRFLMKRDQAAEAQPKPTDSPSRLSRRKASREQAENWESESPTAPQVPTQAVEPTSVAERQVSSQQRSVSSPSRTTPSQSPADAPMEAPERPSLAGARSRSEALPRVGESGLRERRRQPSSARAVEPAGAAPAPQTVAVARVDDSADRMMAPIDVSVSRSGQAKGAQLSMGQSASVGTPATDSASAGTEAARNNLAARSGLPNVSAGESRRASGRTRRSTSGFGFAPAGTPEPARSSYSGDTDSSDPPGSVGDRFPSDSPTERSTRSGGGSIASNIASAAGPALDILAEDGPTGLAAMSGRRAGVVPSNEQPKVAALDIPRATRPRRSVGGPATPFGTKISSVESFSRRVMRTKGGAAPTPAGMVGPATEEAIERGLAYLASIQNQDGSWSLQGHGGDVLLRSDTAATGLCLLAFQGAGYTHRQHQYADSVSRGVQFLLDNQGEDGDLYRSENAISNRNVAFYSHGIAALALCEAYGMTQDPELKEPAQRCLDYIVGTQHSLRGGWRYTAQVSADTSVTGWMMMALKSGQLSGLEVPDKTYQGIQRWLGLAQSPQRPDRYRYNPYAPDTPTQRHGRAPTPTMTAVGMLMRMYSGWRRDNEAMQSAADYLLQYPPQMGSEKSPQRDAYYWYYATQVMFHMGDEHWTKWNQALNPILLDSQVKDGTESGSWDPMSPVPDRWSIHAGRLYVTTMNLLNLEVYYRHLPIYDETAE
ncbi:MAG: hypothetical protein ACR2NZ_01170 [Rubripirellula sp.]